MGADGACRFGNRRGNARADEPGADEEEADDERAKLHRDPTVSWSAGAGRSSLWSGAALESLVELQGAQVV